MEIKLMNDSSVTEELHALVIYDPRQRKFFVQPGTSDGLTYKNDDLLFSHEELRAYDKVAVGKTEFVFIPLCGEKFAWQEHITEG